MIHFSHYTSGSGTFPPPGHWNDIACDLIIEHNLDELESARTLAVLNIALMDAGISCWDTKYNYCCFALGWPIRRSPRLSASRLFLPIPRGMQPFPVQLRRSWPAYFPAQKDRLLSMADEAALSRLYGGIHYRFDNDKGLESGRMIGRVAIKMVMNEDCND
ncbi:MAG: phosphatase PAP2 family protein [Methanothrix sp.]